jgi:hypothetical protein
MWQQGANFDASGVNRDEHVATATNAEAPTTG